MKRTEVYATDEETKEIEELVQVARTTPVIAMSSADALHGRDFSSLAWDRAKKKIHEIALKHGLADTPGYYGIDTSNGEFLEAG